MEVIESENFPGVGVRWLFYRCACMV